MSNWTPIKPKLKKECILITASKWKDQWDYRSWSINKVNGIDGWHLALCDIEGEEWGDWDDLQADLYLTISIPKSKLQP